MQFLSDLTHKYIIQEEKMVYQKGQEILRCQPFTYIVDHEFRSIVCDYCLKLNESNSKPLKKCSACQIVYYCGNRCQKKAWKSHHQRECKGLKNISPNLLFNHDLHVMRIILKLPNGGDREFVELPNGKRRYFRDLMSHHKEISQSEKMHAFQSVILVLKLCLDEKNLPEKSNEVLEIYGKMVINSFEIQDNSMTEGIGQGLYLG